MGWLKLDDLGDLPEANYRVLSLRSIVYRVNNENSMKISKKKIRYYLHNSNEFKLVKPIEVGSGKHKLNVWKKVL